MRIWRLHIKTNGVNPKEFCIDRDILGVGWQVSKDAPLDWDTYWRLGKNEHEERGDKGWRKALNAIGRRMAVDDLCWTYDEDYNYYIGRIEGDWKYRSTSDYRKADVVNVRPCRWFRTGGVDSVPGTVLSNFRVRATVQPAVDKTAAFYARWKYNQLSKTDFYDLARIDDPNLFSLISSDDCEDIVGIYLQETRGYRLIPSTCKRDTPKTEFVLRNANGKAHVQVKQGENEILNMDDFGYHDPCNPCEWFLFTTGGRYAGDTYNHVHCLDPVKMRDFALNNRTLMSRRVQSFIQFMEHLPPRKGRSHNAEQG